MVDFQLHHVSSAPSGHEHTAFPGLPAAPLGAAAGLGKMGPAGMLAMGKQMLTKPHTNQVSKININTEIIKLKAQQFTVYAVEAGFLASLCCFSMCMMRPRKNKQYYADSEASESKSASS